MKLAIALFMVSAQVFGATYYVATNGVASGPGTIGAPWTFYYASTNVAAGDTVLVQPGIYDVRPFFNINGNPSNRITFRANGAVTNLGTLQVYGDSTVIDGFEGTSRGTKTAGNGQSILIGTNSTDVWVINCKLHDSPGNGYQAIGSLGINALGIVGLSSSCVISNNFIYDWSPFNNAAICVFGGTNWLIVNNIVSNTFGGDAFRLWGGSHVLRGNIVKNHGYYFGQIEGAGNAAFNGRYYWSKYHWTNGLGGPVNGPAWTNTSGYVLFDNWNLDPAYSNKWNIINSNGSVTYAASPQPYGTWTMYDSTIVSAPTGGMGANDHPDFLQTWGPFEAGTNLTYYPLQQLTNTLVENNWVEGDFLGTAGQINSSSGTNLPRGVIDITFRNNVFIGLASMSLDAYNVRFYNNTWYNCGKGAGDPYSGNAAISGGFYDPFGSSPRGECFGIEVTNNAFISTGVGNTGQGWYSFSFVPSGPYAPDIASVYMRCDYNYVSNDTTNGQKAISPGWSSNVFKFYEPHGINGGDPNLAYVSNLNLHPMKTSLLIDAGAANTVATNDMEGAVRPLGSAPDIGAYELDPALQMRLDFGADPVGTHKILDITGNGHDAWQMDATNWIMSAGSTPRYSGTFYSNGVMTNQYSGGSTYNKTQYGAITNINTISNLTSGTIMFWVAWNTNYVGSQPEPERFDTIMDAGDLVDFAGAPQYTTNSWAFEYGPFSGTVGAFVFKRWQTNAYVDTSTSLITWSNQTRLVPTNQWWHNAITWTAGGNLVGYENGQPFTTNTTWGMPYLQVGGASPGWICLGALQHSGTPAWDFPDGQPNAAWFKGNMTDVRIYNRVLGSNEIASIYAAATGGATGGGGGAGPTNAPATFSAGAIRAGRVSKP